jgi:hypothetical protein
MDLALSIKGSKGFDKKERPIQLTFLVTFSGRIILTTRVCASRFALVIAWA